MNTTLNRLREYIDFKGLKVSSVEKATGFSNGALASQLRNNKTIGVDKLENILNTYPDVNPTWLLTGQGEMLKSENNLPITKNNHESKVPTTSAKKIPYFEDIQVTAGPDFMYDPAAATPSDFIYVPNFEDCDVSFPLWGDSMWPVYQSGQVVLCKEFHDWRDYVPYGEVFLIITENLRTVKYVKKAESKDHLLLVSENKHFEPFELPKSKILRMFFVKGAIKRNMI